MLKCGIQWYVNFFLGFFQYLYLKQYWKAGLQQGTNIPPYAILFLSLSIFLLSFYAAI